MSFFKSTYKVAAIFSLLFLIVGILTLPRYGINWDTINHLPRGQAYLHYFLTGREDYSDLPSWKLYWQKPESLGIDANIPKNLAQRRSLYQSDAVPFYWLMENDGAGHPPLSDILASSFNMILFNKLGLLNDIDAYRIYGIFLASALIGLLFIWGSKVYGKIAGLIATLSLGLYPLFWSEAHFNIEKDIPETVYWSFTLFSIWKGVTERSWKWILTSGIFFGLGLGTKFNILFVFFVVIPWIVVLVLSKLRRSRTISKKMFIKNIRLILAAIFAPFIGLVIFIGSWPYLWPDPIIRIYGVIKFYKEIGLTQNSDPRFIGPLGMNLYPVEWIIYTTPPVILFLLVIGIIASLGKLRTQRHKISLLFLLWLLVPIIRVSLPNATIYGGVRQIMEYIPALALLSGLGGLMVYKLLTKVLQKFKLSKNLAFLLIFIAFFPIAVKLINIHPNENVYFNFIIGGLKGAKEASLPSWGNSFGSSYRQGIVWINNNAEQNQKIALARELIPNIPKIWIRDDLELHNSYRSGFLRRGEYVIGLTYQGTDKSSYFDRYLERLLVPVYQVKVDGVAVLKVWKNDLLHTKQDYKNDEKTDVYSIKSKTNEVIIDLKKEIKLSRLLANFNKVNCQDLQQAYVSISPDGLNWEILSGNMPKEDWSVPILGDQPLEETFLIPFAADEARYIRISIFPDDACIKQISKLEIYFFN